MVLALKHSLVGKLPQWDITPTK